MFPIGDENDHSGIAYVTIAVIVLNVIAFLIEINRPEECRPGLHLCLGRRATRVHGRHRSATADSVSALDDADHLDVPARRVGAPRRQHAVPVDLRRQHRAPPRPRAVHRLLPGLRDRGEPGAHPLQRRLQHSRRRRLGRDQRRARRLPADVPAQSRLRADLGRRRRPCPALFMLGLWILMQFINGVGSLGVTGDRRRRRRLHGAHRRLRRRPGPRPTVRHRTPRRRSLPARREGRTYWRSTPEPEFVDTIPRHVCPPDRDRA